MKKAILLITLITSNNYSLFNWFEWPIALKIASVCGVSAICANHIYRYAENQHDYLYRYSSTGDSKNIRLQKLNTWNKIQEISSCSCGILTITSTVSLMTYLNKKMDTILFCK